MVWSARVIHMASSVPDWNVTPLSFVALEKSIEVVHESSGANGGSGEVLVPARKSKRHTMQPTIDINIFKGIIAPHHQSHCPRNVFLVEPRPHEFPETKTVRQA